MIAAAVSMHNNSLAMTRNCSVRDTTATTSGAFTPLNTQWLWTQSYVQEWHNDKLYIKQFSIANAWIKLIRCSFMLVHSPFQCTTAECWTLKFPTTYHLFYLSFDCIREKMVLLWYLRQKACQVFTQYPWNQNTIKCLQAMHPNSKEKWAL